MSHNNVALLGGLAQFPALRNLSLGSNRVADVRELEALARACPALENLILEGNPLASWPNYRAHVLCRLPK